MKVRLTRLESSHRNLRTDSVEGDAPRLPKVGHRFSMAAAPLDPAADIRLIETSPVFELVPGGFKTMNSHYQLEVLE